MLKKHHFGPWQKDILFVIGLAAALVSLKAALDARMLAKLPWLLSDHFSTAMAGAVLIFGLLIFIRVYPGKHRSSVARKVYSVIRKVSVAVIFAGAYLSLAVLWDVSIARLYGSIRHYHLGFLIPPLFVGILAWLLISMRWIWNLRGVNSLLILLIHKYLQYDPLGTRYGDLRSRLYNRRGYEWTERRYELALLKLIESCATRLQGEMSSLEVQHLNNGNAKLSVDILGQALKRGPVLATWRGILSEHYYPSYRREHEKEEKADFVRTCDMRRLAAVEQIEAVWLMAKRFTHLMPDKNVAVNAILKDATQGLQTLYQHFETLPDTAFSSPLPRAITQYRLSVLNGANASTLAQKLCSLQVQYLDIHDTFSIRLWRIGVESWLVESAAYGDEQSIIQGCQLIIDVSLARQAKLHTSLQQANSSYAGTFSHTRRQALEASISQESDLQREVYRYLAYAWWRHARKLGSDEFGEYAWQKGLENLRMAEDILALDTLESPFRQKQP
jgi:hypothetical protein